MKGATYDSEKDLAYILPGDKWKDVIPPLASFKKTVVGGRLDIVGVGGYLTGGGLSFLSAQYGMAADTITNFETVMAVSIQDFYRMAYADFLRTDRLLTSTAIQTKTYSLPCGVVAMNVES